MDSYSSRIGSGYRVLSAAVVFALNAACALVSGSSQSPTDQEIAEYFSRGNIPETIERFVDQHKHGGVYAGPVKSDRLDLDGDGDKDLLMIAHRISVGSDGGSDAFISFCDDGEHCSDPYKLTSTKSRITATGVCDVNGDGHPDMVIQVGPNERPERYLMLGLDGAYSGLMHTSFRPLDCEVL
jgi:hypothetical protein